MATIGKATDWRKALRRNHRRTRFVISLFILIYLAIGLLIDVYLYTGTNGIYPNIQIMPITATQALVGLLTFKFNAYATFIMGLIAVIAVLITYKAHAKIILLGTLYKQVTADSNDLKEQQLYNTVEELKIAAGLRFMPKVFIIDAGYMNAFASGVSEKSSLVAITRGLLVKLNRAELQAVMAHELSHIKHHDIKLTMMTSVLANIMLVAIDVLFYSAVFSRTRGKNKLIIIIMILRYVLPMITVLLMLYLSRTREYMADSGCVQLMRDNQPLADALIKIHQDHQVHKDTYHAMLAQTPHENLRRAAYLYDPLSTKAYRDLNSQAITNMYSTHPSLEDRLAALGVDYNTYIKQDISHAKSSLD